jgi:3-oxoacyl-(acyl-carrier-protein) synthase/acyl carrier protein
MALEAAININGRNGQALEDVVIPAALLLKESTTRTVQLVMSPEQDGVQAFALCSFEKGDETDPSAWTEHASGKMIAAGPEAAQLTSEKPETIQQRCSMQISKPDFYEFMFAREYELQTHFQLVEHIWRNPDRSKGTTDNMEVVCKLFNDNGPHTRGYTLYPVFFDCCIQIIMSMVAWDIAPEDFTSYVPLGMQRFNLYGRSAGQDLWCHTKLHDGQDLLSDVLVADLRLINTEGDVIAEALNFRVKKAGRELLMQSVQEDLSDWYYEMQWTEKSVVDDQATSEKGTYLIFAEGTTGTLMAENLASEGNQCVMVSSGSAYRFEDSIVTLQSTERSDYERLLDDPAWASLPPCVGVVHMWASENCKFDDPSATDLQAAARDGVYSVLNLVRSLDGWSQSPRMWVVTRGTQSVTEEDNSLALAHAPVWGMAKVVALEMPSLQCIRVDLSASAGTEEVGQLLEELKASSGDVREVAFRSTNRFISELARRKRVKGNVFKAAPDRSYLVTGGFGGLGLEVARWLAKNGAKFIVLMSRRNAPSAGPVAQAIEDLVDAGVKVTIGQGDVSKEDQVKSVLDKITASGAPLGGVIHSAGVLDDKMLPDMDWNSMQKVMAAKVQGARNLHSLTQDLPLDLFVMFSSATSVIGNKGQSNYAAANAYLDSLAFYRRAHGLPALTINWGPWADIGMAGGDKGLAKLLGSIGVDLIPPDSGMQVLETAITSDSTQLVCVRIAWGLYLQQFGSGVPAMFEGLSEETQKKKSTKKKRQGAAGAEEVVKKLSSVPESKRHGVLAGMIQERVMSILGINDASVISTTQAISEFGLDSMMSVELRNDLQELVGTELSGTLLFDYPTIEALVNYLMDDVLCLTEGDEGPTGTMDSNMLDKMRSDPVAIIGMSCRMPGGGNDPESFWQLLRAGKDCTRSVPKERWDMSYYFDPDPSVPGKSFVDNGGFLTCPVDLFDAQFFGISKREAEFMDPAQRMLLEVTWEALEAAGINPETIVGSRTGSYTGLCACDYQLLETKSGDLTSFSGLYGTGNSHAVAAGRIAYTFGLKGPAYSVDTACSSALLAVHLGCQDLRAGITNMAVAGGVHVLLAPDLYINFAKAKMLSPNGRCATFDETADGFCRGEGSSILILKRLSDAVKAGDPIAALIRGSATNQDGRSNSLTAPNGPAQQAVISEALNMGGVDPTDVSYLECHGTGTSLGDPIEVGAAGAVLGRGRTKPLILGSVKAVIGHLEAAAGISGLTKILMCMRHEEIPPQIHFTKLNPMINIDTIPAVIPLEPTPWKTADSKLIAGVSSFGFGGSNVHAVLEKYRPPPKPANSIDRPIHVVPLSGNSEKALADLANSYLQHLQGHCHDTLEDIAFTAGAGRQHFTFQGCLFLQLTDYSKRFVGTLHRGQEHV